MIQWRTMHEKRPLAKTDWEDAAISVIAAGGVAAVSIEAIARKLGVTKGSFYWHFEDRAALLSQSLLTWERRYTDRVIEALESVRDPGERLRRLISETNVNDEAWRVHVALSVSVHEPAIAEALARVTKRRIAYVEACYRALRFPKAVARSRAVLAYAAYLGFLHLRLEGPSELPRSGGREAYLAAVLDALVPADSRAREPRMKRTSRA